MSTPDSIIKPDQKPVSAPRALEEGVICNLGRIEYGAAWALQKRIQSRLIEAKRQTPPLHLPQIFLMLEHPPVFTLGKSGDPANMRLDKQGLERHGASYFEIDRGGDITFHGPGQLVGYPILDLDRVFTDIGRYLRTLEEIVIRTCADFGVSGRRIKGRTGVWVGDEGSERKICAMGIRCSRWVTMHGFALNVNTDLNYFSFMVPCGIPDRGVTSLAKELKTPIDEKQAQSSVGFHFGELFSIQLRWMDPAESIAFLDQL